MRLWTIFLLCLSAMASPLWAAPSVYDYKLSSLGGKDLPLKAYEGKVLLLVNTASHCGYTKQFSGLEKLYKAHKEEGLVVLGVPSSSFKQEFKDDAEVAQFCKLNYGVTFPMSKIVEVKGPTAHPLFQHLVSSAPAAAQGEVQWNFEKFLIDRKGQVVGRYPSGVAPEDPQLSAKIKELLAQKSKSH